MATIAKIGGVTWASVAKVNGIAVASIAKICGMDKPAGEEFTEGWLSPVRVATVGDSIVVTTGTLVYAKNFGELVNCTVNGVLFTGTTTWDHVGPMYASTGLYTEGVIGTDFEKMMDSFAYNSPDFTVDLSGLTVGVKYMLQMFFSDDRGTDRIQHVHLKTITSESFYQNHSVSVICYFEADATTVTVQFHCNNACICNGFQLRTFS